MKKIKIDEKLIKIVETEPGVFDCSYNSYKEAAPDDIESHMIIKTIEPGDYEFALKKFKNFIIRKKIYIEAMSSVDDLRIRVYEIEPGLYRCAYKENSCDPAECLGLIKAKSEEEAFDKFMEECKKTEKAAFCMLTADDIDEKYIRIEREDEDSPFHCYYEDDEIRDGCIVFEKTKEEAMQTYKEHLAEFLNKCI